LDDLIAHKEIHVIVVQEHWLTPAKLCLFESRFADYFAFGGSAMSSCLQSGILRGRPYGGVMTLIKKGLRKVAMTTVSLKKTWCCGVYIIRKFGRLISIYYNVSESVVSIFFRTHCDNVRSRTDELD